MAKRNVKIPKGSWLDQKGQRWMKVIFDVMIGGGEIPPSDYYDVPDEPRYGIGKIYGRYGQYERFQR